MALHPQLPSGVVPIEPAKLVQVRVHRLPGPYTVAELSFEVPLDHRQPAGESIRLFARAALGDATGVKSAPAPSTAAAAAAAGRPGHAEAAVRALLSTHRPWLVFLEGGPGAGNREPQNSPLTRPLLQRGYQVLYLDYRGTGLSSTISAETLRRRCGDNAAAQAAYLRHFRADSIVYDLEAVRQCLLPERNGTTPWTLLGHSFGGFVSMTYLSFYPDGVREVFVTGGLPPITAEGKRNNAHGNNDAVATVYRATYRKARQRSAAYHRKFPEDAAALRQIAAHLDAQPGGRGLPLPSGGFLTTQRLLTMGYTFGFHGGLDVAHALVLRLRCDLDQVGLMTRPTLVAVEQFLPLDIMPLYALLHEAIYCDGPGVASRWAADRAGRELAEYGWLRGGPLPEIEAPLLSGEMIYPFMFDTFPELMELKEVGELLAAYDKWPALYDRARLATNRVPVYAVSFVDDLYVDIELARETASMVANVHVYETNGLYHNALRMRTDEVLTHLFRMRDDVLD